MARESSSDSGLQVADDPAWQSKFWNVQRIGWIILGLVILAALLGATGKGGALASASARTPAGTIEYPRITRWQSNEQVTVRLPPQASGKVELLFSSSFSDLFSVSSVLPEPTSVLATGEGHRFTFDVAPGGEKLIVFSVTPGKPKFGQPLRVTIGDAPPTDLTVTILP